MTVIITMAGRCSRFKEVGINLPKYMVITRGLSLFEWSMRSLQNFFEQDFVFAVLSSCDVNWISQKADLLGIKNYSFHFRNDYSSGQAETAFDATIGVDKKAPLWIYDIDTYVANSPMCPDDIKNYDGCVHICRANSPNMSYVKHDESGTVIQVAEKQIISDWGTIGLVGFKTGQEFIDTYTAAYLEKLIPLTNNEQYLAPIIQVMITRNKSVISPVVDHKLHHSLGTPFEIREFDSEFKF